MSYLTPETATVYRAAGRRYLTKMAAYRAMAREAVTAKHMPDEEEPEVGYFYTEEERAKCEELTDRLARLLAYRDRTPTMPPGPDMFPAGRQPFIGRGHRKADLQKSEEFSLWLLQLVACGWTQRAIAKRYELSETSVSYRINRARKLLEGTL